MAVTRINNNQITDASAGNVYLGIDASTKLQNYSITSGKIANSLVYGSDLTVTGNLTVQGNTTAIDTTITTIEDPVIVLASTQTGSPSVDIGFIGQRGTSENIAFVWQESTKEFVTAFTSTAAGPWRSRRASRPSWRPWGCFGVSVIRNRPRPSPSPVSWCPI
jgi:hypothetical protein